MLNLNFFDEITKLSLYFLYSLYFSFFKNSNLQITKVNKASNTKFSSFLKKKFWRFFFSNIRVSIRLLLHKAPLAALSYLYWLQNKNLISLKLLNHNKNVSFYLTSILNSFYTNISIIFKYFSLSLFLFLVYVYLLSVYNITPFLKLFFSWFSFGLVGYLLVSGFVYFFKKYTFSKYTDVLQRFWKRSFGIFWLLEGTVFLTFIYLTLNSSSEIFYGYDSQVLYKLHLGSLRIFFFKLILINAILILLNYLLVVCQSNSEDTIFSIYVLISAIILYTTWIEFYQFYIYLQSINFYSWIYSFESYEFSLDSDLRRSRTLNNYMLVCVAAKFWHFVFIIFVWFFYLNRYLESTDIRISLISTSIQNFLILYVLNLIILYPYLKFLTRRYLNITYKWFFVEINETNFKLFVNFLFTFYTSII